MSVLVTRLGPALPKADLASLWIDTVQQGQMLREVRATGRADRAAALAASADVWIGHAHGGRWSLTRWQSLLGAIQSHGMENNNNLMNNNLMDNNFNGKAALTGDA
ncbi:MAG: hypothetical protein ACYCZD_08920 [Rhodanobacter sp.]